MAEEFLNDNGLMFYEGTIKQRLKEKADSTALDNKVDKKSGYDLVSSSNITQISTNKTNISTLQTQLNNILTTLNNWV